MKLAATVKKFALISVFALLAPFSLAFAATVSWTNPTTFADGSPLVAADIANTKIEWATTSAFTTIVGSVTVAGAATSTTAPADPAVGGTFCYRGTTTVVAAKGGGSSVPSNSSCKTKPFSNPNPPTLLDAIIAWIVAHWHHFA